MSILTPKTAGYVNLTYCVAQVKADIQDYTDRNDERFTQWAIRECVNMNLFQGNSVDVVYLEMDPNGIVDISSLTDYVDYSKIAMLVNGKYWILGINEKIGLNRTELDATEAALIFKTGAPDIEVGSGYVFADHYTNGTLVSGLFGLGGGFSRSFFRVDMEKLQIQFDTAIPRNQIILEYISTGVKLTGATTVPRSACERLIAFIHWQLNEHNPLVDRFTKRDKKQEYLERIEEQRSFDLRFDPIKFLQSMYISHKQTVKM